MATRFSLGTLSVAGAPKGHGMHYNRFLHPGDVLEGTICRPGAQRNTRVAETR
jgi:2-keto-4-pentenoate hydratase/2-oxohepta-3-ene-1,7-dioic acid hydratase in catechol pathway